MNQQQFQELIERYLSEQSTPGEKEQLHQLLKEPRYISQLEAYMDGQLANSTVTVADYPVVVERIKQKVDQEIRRGKKMARITPFGLFIRLAAAAAIVLIITSTAFLLLNKKKAEGITGPAFVSSPSQKIVPGKEGAILTLADGRTIVLDSAGNGLIATQNGAEVVLNNGQVIYKAGSANELVHNTMFTPKGRQFRLVLPDGTKAWLNAASSLRYPIAFIGTDRRVEVTGEVYFEVAKNQQKPFIVEVNESMEVVVLGTHFNINAYPGESSINTTLLEGSVQIINSGDSQLLKPGEQAQVKRGEKIRRVSGVDIRRVMAWKNGVFDFDGASLKEVMRQLERWYDIEVVYEKGVPDLEFVGTMGRDLVLEDVLEGLKLSEVNFRLEGRKLVVMP